jgi:hypothetical protein
MNPLETNRLVNAAHDARTYARAEGDDYYSKHDPRFGRTGYFVDRRGNPTTGYPHVHVIADERQGKIFLTASRSKHEKVGPAVELPISASGNEVNAAAKQLGRYL